MILIVCDHHPIINIYIYLLYIYIYQCFIAGIIVLRWSLTVSYSNLGKYFYGSSWPWKKGKSSLYPILGNSHIYIYVYTQHGQVTCVLSCSPWSFHHDEWEATNNGCVYTIYICMNIYIYIIIIISLVLSLLKYIYIHIYIYIMIYI